MTKEITMNKKRIEQLLNECVDYLVELKEREDKEELLYFWKNIIGMTDEEIKYFGVMNNE